jgi:hypothetical protein
LKAGLKRAAFYDRRERLAAESGMAPAPAATAAETIGAKFLWHTETTLPNFCRPFSFGFWRGLAV